MKTTNQIQILLVIIFNFLAVGCVTAQYEAGHRRAQDITAQHQESRLMGTQSISLFRQSWHPLKKTKAVVIFVHGLKDYSDRYQEIALQLTRNNYAVYAYDQRGLGDSAGRRVWVDSFDDYIKDLALFYDEVKKAEPNQPIFIFGHSMGGAIVTLFALEEKRPVQGIILSAPALKATDDLNGFIIGTTKFLGAVTPTMAVMKLKDEDFSRDQNVVKSMPTDPLIYDGKGPARTASELLKTIGYIQEHMQELKVPFLALHGEKDLLTNPEGSKELYQKAAVKDKTLKIYASLYHDLLHEPEKAMVAGDILAWLDKETKVTKK